MKGNQRFGGTFSFYLQGKKISEIINQHEPDNKHSRFLHFLFIDLENGDDIFF
jgi:hypothetical protein